MTDETTSPVAETAPAPSEAAPAAEPRAEPSIAEILAYDPFEAAEPETTKPVVKAPKAVEPPVVAPAAPVAEPVAPAIDPNVAALRDAVADLVNREAAPTAPAATPEAKPQQPRFNFQVPNDVVNALRSDDQEVATHGLNALVNGLSNAIWQAQQEFIASELIPQIPRMIQQHMSMVEERRRVHDEFYGAYPHLNKPELKPFVGQLAIQLAQETGAKTWDTAFSQKLVERLATIIPMTPAPSGQPKAKPKFNSGGGSPRQPAENPIVTDIRDTLFG
jgi:hypothetical protein